MLERERKLEELKVLEGLRDGLGCYVDGGDLSRRAGGGPRPTSLQSSKAQLTPPPTTQDFFDKIAPIIFLNCTIAGLSYSEHQALEKTGGATLLPPLPETL